MKIAEIELQYKGNNRTNTINNSHKAFDAFISKWDMNKIYHQEEMKILLLNRANQSLGIYHLSTGGLNSTIVDIKLIMATALKSLASSIILAHNHPSGNLKPSNMDKIVTRKVQKACKVFEIDLYDHLIITENQYYSFADENILPY